MSIIIKPIISEKSLKEATVGRYTFLVDNNATKEDIKRAVKKMFDVDVKKVSTNVIKKTDTSYTRFKAKKKEFSYKKARVVLGKDQKLEIFEEAMK